MSENYLNENLRIIAEVDSILADTLRRAYNPDYPELRTAKDSSPIPVIDRKSLHSSYDPHGEAQKWVDSLNIHDEPNSLIIVGGIGFGYHLEALFKVVAPDRVIVVEREIKLAAAALATRPPTAFPPGMRLIVSEKPVLAFQKIEVQAAPKQSYIRFIEHPASSQVYPDFYPILRGMFHCRSVVERGGYKILLVSPLYGGSLPMAQYVQRALTRLGHRCEILDNSVFYPGYRHLEKLSSNKQHTFQLQNALQSVLAESVTARALEIHADLVLALAQAPVTPDVLKELKNAEIPTSFWFVEDGRSFEYWKTIAPHYDHFFTIQRDEFHDDLKKIGCRNPHYLATAADLMVHSPQKLTPEELQTFSSDVSHVGAGYYNRRHLFTGLLDYNFKIWGSDWEKAGILDQAIQRQGARISIEETCKIFSATTININLHSSQYHEGVNPFGDFINPRTFELGGCGAFQLVDQRKYLAENFEIGSEIETFGDLQELRDKIDYFLAHGEERQMIAIAAHQRILAEHTYDHRLSEMMGVIAAAKPDWEPRAGGLPTAEEIIRQAGEDSELAGVMRRFIGKGPLTLEDVAQDIEQGEGELVRAEAMILLLNEFRRWGLEKGVM
jgi:spore maturation protein CgeB